MTLMLFFFFQAEDGIRDGHVTGVQTCALPISGSDERKKEASAADKEGLYASREPAMPLLPEKRQGSGAIIRVMTLILLVGAALAAYFYFAGEEEYSDQQQPVGTVFSPAGRQGEGRGGVPLA